MTRITPNPVINESYFRNRNVAQKIAGVILADYSVTNNRNLKKLDQESLLEMIRKILDDN